MVRAPPARRRGARRGDRQRDDRDFRALRRWGTAGFFELDAAAPSETELAYFGLAPEFIGCGFGPYLLQAAIDRAWSRPIERFWVHTCTFDHPKALGVYQRAGFVVYDRRRASFEDPRERGILPRSLTHPLLPALAS